MTIELEEEVKTTTAQMISVLVTALEDLIQQVENHGRWVKPQNSIDSGREAIAKARDFLRCQSA